MKTANETTLILNETILTKSWLDDGNYRVHARRDGIVKVVHLPTCGASQSIVIQEDELCDWTVV